MATGGNAARASRVFRAMRTDAPDTASSALRAEDAARPV
jgi:hypothetical protein